MEPELSEERPLANLAPTGLGVLFAFLSRGFTPWLWNWTLSGSRKMLNPQPRAS